MKKTLLYICLFFCFTEKVIAATLPSSEAVNIWRSINEQQGNFLPGKTPSGILVINNNQLHIAYHTPLMTSESITQNINQTRYFVTSHDWQNLGIAAVRAAMNQYPTAYTCYPKDYVFKTGTAAGNFVFANCAATYSRVLDAYPLSFPLTNNRFIALGVYSIYQFFGVEDGSAESLKARINNICAMSWHDLKMEYADSGIPDTELANLCADGVYLSTLLYGYLHLSGDKLWITNKLGKI